MNQHRWTCLATVVLSTVVGPISTIQAKTLSSPAVGSSDRYLPVSPQSLPTITPLVVTELETEAVIPVTFKTVPTVSKLPPIAKIARQTKNPARSKRYHPASTQSKKPALHSPVAKLPVISTFNSTVRIATPFGAQFLPNNSIAAVVNPVTPLPSSIATPAQKLPLVTPFTAPTPTVATISSPSDRIQIDSLPQVSSIASIAKDRSDLPSFESGTPVFGINNNQTLQIVNTVIAQVGETIVAPEPSIAIPVEQPKQSTTPTQLPIVVPPTVTIEQPAATIEPALDRIVATQSGQASWYGIEGGPRTANGERYNPRGLTAAHRTLPFGTKVRVTSLKTGKTVTVRINDRGPFHSRRILDVSAGAAEVIGIKNDGIGNVRMDVLETDG